MAWLTPDDHTAAVEAARDIVLRRLDRSPAPRAALAQLLERKDVDAAVAEEVLDRLEAAGLIDDAAYAAMLARTRFAEKGVARRGVAEELRRKGLSQGCVAQALEHISEDDERHAARRLAQRKLTSTRGLDPVVRRRRTLAFLGRKGYSAALAQEAYDYALAQEQDPAA